MRNKMHETITTTELVRNLSVVIDKVRVSGRSLYVTKGSQTVAELSPPPKVGCPVSKLADTLRSLPRLEEEGTAMAKDL
ncbi:MAG: hypothetical protein D8M57_16325 [Candidatus Scalindua sp. AMX11]|nr:MAG: hypothetical protein DWQ00_07095 [Candidatus Scalindua sp.]NOG82957.1 hypothetical protein [Planctomycetota bacterium]RZV68743.1 MAG: hypothetical protein EX341_16410 [Candidatus Scalindua sp. SCAELEC01]TDE63832.1 MAG: hypothetical protein D8M57_16325 [Candidatus Scalindua sp. AMX11]